MPEYDKTSTLQKKYKLPKSNPSERKTSLRNSNPADMIKRAELDPQSIMHADVMQLQKAVGNKLVYQLLAEMEQVNSRTKIPAVSPGNSAIIQKVDDPNGQLFKMFRDCAYKVRVSKFYIKESEIKKIIKGSATVDAAFESWMDAVIKIQNQNGLLAVKAILSDEEIKKIMRAERQRIKSQRDKEELDARFVSPPPKDTTYDMEMEEKVPDGEMEEYMKSPTRDDQYEKMLEESYTGIQAISSQTMDEAFEEQGWMNKGKITDKGQQLLNWAKANIGKDSMGITPIQQAFILTHFIPSKDGSLGMQPFPNSTVSLEINFQEAVSATVNSGVIPGVGTYDQHLDRMQKDPIDDLYFTNISGTKEERKARLVEKLKAKGYEDQKAAGMAEEIIKEEDKTRNLQFLEQTRNFEDQIATSMAFEGVNDIWSLNQGLGQRLNPMHNKSATSSINKIRMGKTGKALQDARRVRKEITKTAKTTLKEAIVRTKRAKRTNPKMYLALRAVREYLKNPKSEENRIRVGNHIRRMYRLPPKGHKGGVPAGKTGTPGLQKPIVDEKAKIQDEMFKAFAARMNTLPREKVGPVDFSQQYATVDKSMPPKKTVELSKKHVFDRTRFDMLLNEGGGDCLFHALEGRNISLAELVKLRAQVADKRRGMPDNLQSQGLNAHNIASAISQTPSKEAVVDELTTGRHYVPNDIYADLQKIPGIYAGEDELIQWCSLKNMTVGVVSSDGTLARFSKEGRQQFESTEEKLQELYAHTNVMLYKTPAHWEKIAGIKPLIVNMIL